MTPGSPDFLFPATPKGLKHMRMARNPHSMAVGLAGRCRRARAKRLLRHVGLGKNEFRQIIMALKNVHNLRLKTPQLEGIVI
jgi:hypothetical protein